MPCTHQGDAGFFNTCTRAHARTRTHVTHEPAAGVGGDVSSCGLARAGHHGVPSNASASPAFAERVFIVQKRATMSRQSHSPPTPHNRASLEIGSSHAQSWGSSQLAHDTMPNRRILEKSLPRVSTVGEASWLCCERTNRHTRREGCFLNGLILDNHENQGGKEQKEIPVQLTNICAVKKSNP